MADLQNQQEVKNRKYKYCTIDCGEDGQYLAKVAYSESTRAWGPTEVEYDGKWMTIEEFEDTPEGGSYSCENYRIVA